jgi:hypothetical protein
MLPKNLKYGNKVQSSLARSYTSNIQPNGALSGYSNGSVCTINIPTGPNLALIAAESVLKFDLKNNDAVDADSRFDSGGAHGIIKRIRVFHGSNLLEDTDNYGLLAREYFDLQVSTDASYGKYSILSGTRQDLVVSGATAFCVNSGAIFKGATTKTFTLTLLSILGSLSGSNYFPLFECTSAPLRLEIQFVNSLGECCCCPAAPAAFTINNIEYIASYIELSSEALSIIKSGQDGVLSYTIQGVRNYNTSVALSGGGATTQVNFNIPAKFGSVKSVIASIRDSSKGVNTALYFPHSCDVNGLTSYYFKIGSKSSIPAIAPSTLPQYFCELLKAVGSISDINHEPSIDLTSYEHTTSALNTQGSITDGDVQSGSFYIGLDLENYAETDKSTIYTGYDTRNDDMYLSMTFVRANAMASARLDAFVMFDQELVFANGTCYVSF